jgi:hypothetical protein
MKRSIERLRLPRRSRVLPLSTAPRGGRSSSSACGIFKVFAQTLAPRS